MTLNFSIIGSGSIGVGWAIVFARAKCHVVVYDIKKEQLDIFNSEVADRLNLLQQNQLLSEPPIKLLARISTSLNLAKSVKNADYIQECAPENAEVKKKIFQEIEKYSSPNAIIASSSSALKISEFATHLLTRQRCLVVHPGNPPYLLSVAEVVPADFTSQEVVTRTMEILRFVKMDPVKIHKEIDGFVFNRLQGAILREAYCLVRDGVIDPLDLDLIMVKGLGKRWSIIGPFTTSALNVQGGIRAHAARMASSYENMGKVRGQRDPWTPELVEKVANRVEEKFENESWRANILRRDLALMKINKLMNDDLTLNFYN